MYGRDVNGLKKKKRKSTTRQWNLKIMQPSLQYLIVCPYYKHFWLLAVLSSYYPSFLQIRVTMSFGGR